MKQRRRKDKKLNRLKRYPQTNLKALKLNSESSGIKEIAQNDLTVTPAINLFPANDIKVNLEDTESGRNLEQNLDPKKTIIFSKKLAKINIKENFKIYAKKSKTYLNESLFKPFNTMADIYLSKAEKVLINYDVDRAVIISAILTSLLFFIYYYFNNLITAYGDSKGHLNITRRVVDSLTPGLAQLGGYWLPVPHSLMLPAIWNDFLWKSGIAGSLPSMLFYIISVIFIYKTALVVTNNKFSSFIAALVVLTNLNFLYMQVAPMTESIFLGFLSLFAYYFAKFAWNQKVTDIIVAALFVALATLTRYEGWGLLAFACGVLIIFIMSDVIIYKEYYVEIPKAISFKNVNKIKVYYPILLKYTKHFSKKKEGTFVLFATLGVMGVVFWLMWGLLIFKDPLEFMHNDLSAANQTQDVYARHITGYLNPWLAFLTNFIATININGLLVVIIGVIGFIVLTYQNYKNKSLLKEKYMFFIILVGPFIFDVISVFFGEVPVEVKFLKGSTFNVRYSLFSLPYLAISTAYLTNFLAEKQINNNAKYKIKLLFVILIIVNCGTLAINGLNRITVLQDAGVNKLVAADFEKINFVRDNYKDGLIMASTGSMDGFMYDTKLPLKNYIVEGSYRYWDKALDDPASVVKWVIYSENNERDAVFIYANKEKLKSDFDIAFEDGNFKILKRKW